MTSHESPIRTEALMGTFVTIHVVESAARGSAPRAARGVPRPSKDGARTSPAGTRTLGAARETVGRSEAIDRAFDWFRRVEACCTRFDPRSELMRLTGRIGVATPVSPILYEALQFALAVAEASGGAFDPTVGRQMEARGFDREHRTGAIIRTPIEAADVSYRDVRLDSVERSVTLLRPLILDLGSIAKGLAIDLAARELRAFDDYAIDAGGDLYLAGCNAEGVPWSVGIRHPRDERRLLDSLRVSDRAVCTSGDYERRSSGGRGHHILDPRAGTCADAVASVTVVAPTATLADALATAAFVLGPGAGLRLCERHGVDGLMVSPGLHRHATRGMYTDYHLGRHGVAADHDRATVLPDAEGASPADPGDARAAGGAR